MKHSDSVLQQALHAHKAGDHSGAMKIYNSVLDADPQNVNALHLLGMACHEQGRYSEAAHLLRRAIEVKPQAGMLYNALGVVQMALGQYHEAKATLERAVSLNPSAVEPYTNLGLALRNLGAADVAKSHFLEALRCDPQEPVACLQLGHLEEEQGDSESAERYYREAIASGRADREGYLALTRLLVRNRRLESARQTLQEALSRLPNEAELHFELGMICARKGQHEEAITHTKRSLAIQPNSPIAHDQLGLSLVALGHPDEALSCFREALRLAPERHEYCLHLGIALRRAGCLSEAVEQLLQVVQMAPESIEGKRELGIAYRWLGDLDRAEPLLNSVLRFDPTHGETLFELAKLYDSQGKLQETIELGVRVLKEDRSFAPGHLLLGMAFLSRLAPEHRTKTTLPERAQVTEKAVYHLREAARIKPSAETFGALGNGLMQASRHEEAFDALRRSIELGPDFAKAYIDLGKAHLETGNTESAREFLEKAVELDPNGVEAYYELSRFGKFESADRAIANLRELQADSNRPLAEQMHIRFALARQLDGQGAHDAAFAEYLQANSLKMKMLGIDSEADAMKSSDFELGRKCIKVFHKQFVESHGRWGSQSEMPIFIVGMPRSGTTLVEQILSSHAKIHGAGELLHIWDLAFSLPVRLSSCVPYPEVVAQMDESLARELADEYLAELRRQSGAALRVTDKMPTNFRHLGLINLLLPNARVIHVIRDPMDVCVSCLRQNLEFPFCDMGSVGRYYRAYERLMHHWKSVLPLRILDVYYEELVLNQEEQTRRLIDFCGLSWDEQCLDFVATERAVQTPSKWQVRQPIYRSSIGGWKKYDTHLDPLKAALAESY